jgi:DNA-binding IscR family transcriptional regulator
MQQGPTVLEVVEAVEGPVRLNVCLAHEHACERQHWCPAHTMWARAQEALVGVLRATSIADLAKQVPQWN